MSQVVYQFLLLGKFISNVNDEESSFGIGLKGMYISSVSSE